MLLAVPARFAYHRNMDADPIQAELSAVAAAIAEPARTRMLCSLMDGRARTGTELAIIAGVGAPTACAHLAKLVERRLVKVRAQGRHRYYQLHDGEVAAAVEALMAVANVPRKRFATSAPERLRHARTCYDHMAGTLGVALHDRLFDAGWLAIAEGDFRVTPAGAEALARLDVDLEAARAARRRFACACLDWSERRPHLAGALGAEILATALRHRWVIRNEHDRALSVTAAGRRAFQQRFGFTA